MDPPTRPRACRGRSAASASAVVTLVFVGGVAALLLWLAIKQPTACRQPPRRPLGPAAAGPLRALPALRTTLSTWRFRSGVNLRTATGVRLIEPFGFSCASHSRKTLLAAAAPMQLLAHQNTLIPLRMDEGVYWVRMQFPDGQSARAVVDTGSSNLVIGSQLCRRCPLHRNGVVVHPDHANIHARNVHIAYGSQRVFTDVTMNMMHIQGLELDSELSRSMLQNADGMVAHVDGAVAPMQEAVRVHTEVFMMKRVEGATAANVFGMAPSPARVARPSLLSLLLPDHPRFGVMLGTHGGAMVLGPPPQTSGDALRVVHVPVERPVHLRHTPTLFFMTRLLDVLVGPSLDTMRSAFADAVITPPLWAMFDTGSTSTFTSTALRTPLRAAHHAAGTATPFISLVLANGVHFVLSPGAYVWKGSSTLDMDTSFVNDLLRVEGVLVGCMASRGIFMDHDVAGERIGFAAMHSDFSVDG